MSIEAREYDSKKAMQKDLRRMEAQGFEGQVTTRTDRRRWSCCLGFLPALLFGGKTKYLVTYRR